MRNLPELFFRSTLPFVFILFSGAAGAFGQDTSLAPQPELRLEVAITNWEGYHCTISLSEKQYATTNSSTLSDDTQVRHGVITDAQYNDLVRLIQEHRDFYFSDFTGHYPYSRANRYTVSLSFGGQSIEKKFYPTNDTRLDALIEKVKEVTHSDLGWN